MGITEDFTNSVYKKSIRYVRHVYDRGCLRD